MRKVLVFEGRWENGKPLYYEGVFHQWGEKLVNMKDGSETKITVAIIEKDNGDIVTALPERVHFVADNDKLK